MQLPFQTVLHIYLTDQQGTLKGSSLILTSIENVFITLSGHIVKLSLVALKQASTVFNNLLTSRIYYKHSFWLLCG